MISHCGAAVPRSCMAALGLAAALSSSMPGLVLTSCAFIQSSSPFHYLGKSRCFSESKSLLTLRAWSKWPLGVHGKGAAFPHVSKQPRGDHLEHLLLNCKVCCCWASWVLVIGTWGLDGEDAPAAAVMLPVPDGDFPLG